MLVDSQKKKKKKKKKKRNRLAQKRLNGLVFVKYNQKMKTRYDKHDVIDPISLDDIDESNEWVLNHL